MADHHVDRPEVEAGQPVQPTGTNRSTRLIPTPEHPSAGPPGRQNRPRAAPNPRFRRGRPTARHRPTLPPHPTPQGSFAGLVAIARGPTPDPIPNSAVKTLRAHGTASPRGGRVGRRQARQTPKLSLHHPPAHSGPGFRTTVAGWSSPVARQAHNLKVVGSNPAPATTEVDPISATTGPS